MKGASYKKAPGSKGISGPQKAPSAKTSKSKASTTSYCGIQDSRPANNDRKQSAL